MLETGRGPSGNANKGAAPSHAHRKRALPAQGRSLGGTLDPSVATNLMVTGSRGNSRGRTLRIGVRVRYSADQAGERMEEALHGIRAAMYDNWGAGRLAR